jgi:hypothetical protein
VDTATAEANVKAQIGTTSSLFTDFTKSTAADGALMAGVARLVVVSTQQQSAALSSVVGQTAVDGTTITQADLDKLVQAKVLEVLTTAVARLDPATLPAPGSGSSAFQAFDTQVTSTIAPAVVASTGLTSTSAPTLVAIANQATATEPAPAPGPGFSLAALTFTDASNWFIRAFTYNAAQSEPDANGWTRFTERRIRSTSGVEAHWSSGGSPSNQADLHWNGTNWVRCAFGQESKSTVRDAQGRSQSDYCDGVDVGSSQRATFDVSGMKMIDKINEALAAGFTNVSFANPSAALGDAVFPAGSKMYYQTNTPLSLAYQYGTSLNGTVRIATPALAAGNTSPSDTGALCFGVNTPAAYNANSLEPSSLEAVASTVKGNPCFFPQASATITTSSGTATVSSGPRNEWWSNNSIAMGTLGTAPVGGVQSAYYTTNTLLRASFGAGNAVTYYACKQRYEGSPRNCDQIGTGTWSVATLGDARVMSFANQPVQFMGTSERVFIERGGKVYYGFRPRLGASKSVRFNPAAGNAMLTRLGLPTIDPNAAFSLTRASYQGEWMFWLNTSTTKYSADYTGIRIFSNFNGSNPAYQCVDYVGTDTVGAPFSCTVTLDPATGAFLMTNVDGTASGTLKLADGTATATFTPVGGGAVETLVGQRR